MQVSMKDVSRIVAFFRKQQQKYGYEDSGNILQHKWDMRDVAGQIASAKELRQLIEFFMLTSDDRSMTHFFRTYDDYYETMIRVKEDRLRRRYLQQQTLDRAREKDKIE